MNAAYFALDDGSSDNAFIIELADPRQIAHARHILAGKETAAVRVLGTISPSPAPYNPNWSFHLDPATIRFFEVAMEVCDASIAYVEEHLDEIGGSFLPNKLWCPWSAQLQAEVFPNAAGCLHRPSLSEVSALAKSLFSKTNLPVNGNGWVARLDAGLAYEAVLATKELQRRSETLSGRWAELYVQDLRSSLASLDVDMRYFDDLNFRLASQVIDIRAQDESLRIHNDEIAAGYYTVASEVAQLELHAAQAQHMGYSGASSEYEALFQNTDVVVVFADPNKAAQLRAATAAVTVYSPYRHLHNEFFKEGFLKWPWGMNTDEVPRPMDPDHVGPDTLDSPSMVFYTTHKSALCEIASAAVMARSGRMIARENAAAAKHIVNGKARESRWAQADVGFRRDRAEVQISLRELKRQAVETAGGPLNLTEKCAWLRARFVEQLAETVARATVIASAMNTVYGLQWNEQPPLPATWDDGRGSYLAALQSWYMRLDTTLARAQEREAAHVVAVSLKQLVGKAFTAAKEDLKAGKSKMLAVPFHITEQYVGDVRGARIRGVSVSTIEKGTDGSDSWRGRVKVPVAAISVDWSGARHALTQQVPAAEAGRVQRRNNPHPADVVGVSTLRNCSPISDMAQPATVSAWVLELDALSLLGNHAYDIADLVVEIVITGLTPK